jgi:hypothetical protein
MDALGHYHFEHGTTQGWFAQYGESGPGVSIAVTTTTATMWTGEHGLRIGASGGAGSWRAAAGLDDPSLAMSPTGTVTAHIYLPVTSTVTWVHLYILGNGDPWQWLSSPTAALQPGGWVTLTWHISTTVARPIHRFGVQFGGEAVDPLNDALYLDAIAWSHPYTHPIYTGAYLSGTWTTSFANELDCLDQMGGKHAGVINVFVDWSSPFPADIVNAILDHQSTPMITWEPKVDGTSILTDIVTGQYDGYIDQWVQAVAQMPCSTLFLRWGHEMNGNWYPWGGNPEAYKAAWRYAHERMQVASGAGNTLATHDLAAGILDADIAWVWTPNYQSIPDEPWNDLHHYYPGDDYVDWVGVSGFNAASKATWTSTLPCRTFDELFDPILRAMTDRYPKPQMIAEFASACDNGCDQALWIAEAYHQALLYPHLQALVWFNVAKWEGDPERKWVDWRIGCGDCGAPGCPDCVAAYALALADPRYSSTAAGCTACKVYVPLVPRNCLLDGEYRTGK